MSDLRDSLGRWAGERGEEVARAVSVHEGETRAAAGRRRARNLTLAAGAALVGLVGASGLLVAGPWQLAQPALELPTEPVALDKLACGTPWTLGAGTVTHVEWADEYFGGMSGGWVKFTDGGEAVENPGSIEAGSESVLWHGDREVRGEVVVDGIVVAVRDGVIVGSAGADFRTYASYEDSGTAFAGPLPGSCGEGLSVFDDGVYTYHVVIQAMHVTEPMAVLQTIIDPNGPLTVGVSGLRQWGEWHADGTYAHLREPQGDRYQAFVVAPPAPGSCTPYNELMARGAPAETDLEYEVTIPGVQELTGQVWGNQPLVVIDDVEYDAWYVGLRTGITAQEVDGGNPLGALEWTTGPSVGEQSHEGELRLVNTWGAEFPGPDLGDCTFTLPIPALGGAVFLIIDGVDWDTVSETHPNANVVFPDGAQTWVYLGQAEPTTAAPEPEAKTYDAYVVNPPDDLRTCDPIQYLRGSGYPKPNSLQYQVTIPGVIEPVRVDPVAIADESVADQWYFDKPAWLSFDNPGSGHDPAVAWNPRTFTLEQVDGPHPPGRKNCAVTFEFRPPSGGMWLVIGGVDLAALDRANPGADYVIAENSQTWIYLGDLEEPTP